MFQMFYVFHSNMTDRNAFVCRKVLPGQHIKRGQRAALRRSLLGPHDPSAELRAARTGRISGAPPTLRHGEHFENQGLLLDLDFLCVNDEYVFCRTAMQR